jgi:hypothetical protein
MSSVSYIVISPVVIPSSLKSDVIVRRILVGIVAVLVTSSWASGQSATNEIGGVVKSGDVPLPGVTVSATNTATGQKAITSTSEDGSYSVHVDATWTYTVRAEMAAFAAATRDVVINDQNHSARADLNLVLLSRAQQQQAAVQKPRPPAPQPNRGFQSLAVMQSEFGGGSGNGAFNSEDRGAPGALQVPGMSAESATESVSITGNTANAGWSNLSSDQMRQRIDEIRDRQGGGVSSLGASLYGGGPGGPGYQGAPGGGGPGGGGSGRGSRGGGGGFGGGGGGPFMVMGGRGRFNFNQPHGSIYYSAGNSVLNAAPYSLTGAPHTNPSYQQNRFGGSIGGPLNIPKIYNGGEKMFFFVNYNGSRAENPFDSFATVPTNGLFPGTTDERNGIFPNGLVVTNIDPVAKALLQYIPQPNLPGTFKNFHFTTTSTNNLDDLNVRIIRAFGKSGLRGQRRLGSGGGRNNLNVGFHYHSTESNLTNPFPSVGGTTGVRSFDIPVGYVRSFGKLTNNFRFDFNRNRISTQNLYAFNTDVAGLAGVTGVSTNPLDYGIPNLVFKDVTSLNDINPLLRRDQTFTFSDNMIWSHGKHTWRWGGDFRRIEVNTKTASNPRGHFTFTGFSTGNDFADFLEALPQLSTVQFGDDSYHFRGNSWDLYAQDEWRVRSNLTLNLGLRYEYVSPFTEINNLIANLLITGFSTSAISVHRVLPGTPGIPSSLVHPDRNNFAPRIGIAWKPFAKTVVRAGYGMNYNTGAYLSIIQQLAFQPPFTAVQTNRGVPGFAFPTISPTALTNNYGVDPNYRLGYVQIWNLNIQRELTPDLLLNLDYTGTKGTRLDVLEAPNRNPTGTDLLNPNVPIFNFETSRADSIAHAATVRLRKRMRHGFSIGGSYTFSKSIDDASTIGGGTVVVAQNPFNLAAERGVSVFDQRHRLVADYLIELPFGHDKRWLANKSVLRDVLGDWQWSGDWTIASGLPFNPQVIGNFAEVNSGTNGTLRPFLTGQPIALPNPSVTAWFNTAAFCIPNAAEPQLQCQFPISGQFGNAGRNSIEGPGTVIFDMAFTKIIPLGDVRVLELRAQSTNIFNTPQFTAIDTNISSPSFGQVTSVGPMRQFVMQARFRF